MLNKLIKAFFIVLMVYIPLQAREININNLIDEAKKEKKHLFVWLHKRDCGYCESMREFTLQNDTVQSFLKKHFIFLHIDVKEKDRVIYDDFVGDGRAFAKRVGYDFYPSSLFFGDDAEIVFGEVGYIDNKIPNERRFYSILNFINSNSYKKLEFEDYYFEIQGEL